MQVNYVALLITIELFYHFCRQYPTDYKLETYLKIAKLYLENEEPVQAEAYINRASLLQADSNNEELQIHYKVYNLYTCIYVVKGSSTLLFSKEPDPIPNIFQDFTVFS